MKIGRRIVQALCLAVACLSLAACKVELHTGLSETESNDMVALLLSYNIDAEKGPATKEGVPLMVEQADLATAIEILRENGYPRDTFNDLGKVFQEQGLISSPLEERVRYIYGLSQSISETLSQIDGVITARVHVIVPEQHPLDDAPAPSRAAVFLKTRPGVNLESKISKIKQLVQKSVEGLAYDQIQVALFEAEASRRLNVTEGPPLNEFMGFRYTRDSADDLLKLASAISAVIVLLIGGNIALFILFRRARQNRAMVPDG